MPEDRRTATAPVGSGPAADEPDPRRWIALAIVLTAAFMQLIDVTIVNVAIPSIQRNLNATYAAIQWVLAGYQLAFAVALITGGRLGDIAGRRRMFMIGMGGFTVASASCGLAVNPTMLVVSRVVQGSFAAMMYPQVLSVIQVSFPPRERAKAFGIFGATIGLAAIAGPLFGGLLIRANLFGLDWRPIFLVNVPVGIASLVASAMYLHESKSPHPVRLDLIGVAIVSVAVFFLVFPLVEGRQAGWPAWSFVMLVACVPVFAVFAWFERRKSRKDGSPLVEPALFGDRAFVVGLAIAATFFSGVTSFFLTLTLFLQIGLGFSALAAGLTTFPFALGAFVASGMSIRVAPRLGRKVLQLGAGLLAASMVGMIITARVATIPLTGWETIPALLVGGVGLGFIIAPLVNVILAGIHRGHEGSASGVLSTVQQVGGALGVALIGVIYFGLLGSNADASSAKVAPGIRSHLSAAQVPASTADGVIAGFRVCFHDRANQADPTAVPASCRRLQASTGSATVMQQAVGSAVGEAASAALADDFTTSVRTAWLYDVGVFALTFLLVFLLPPPEPKALRRPGAGADAA
jgi:EmrB/QacA subfamily drug resistance transporter